MILIAAMQQVAIEEYGVAWFHLDMDHLQPFAEFFHTLQVGSGLIASQYVIDSPGQMRPFQDLQASIFFCGAIHRDKHAAEKREENSILIPVTVVLVPCPRATNFGLFHDHFGVIMVYFAA